MKTLETSNIINHSLRQENIALKKEIDSLKGELLYMKNEYDKLRKLIFGAKSERFIGADDNQLSFDFLPEPTKDIQVKETEIDAHTRKSVKYKNKPVRTALPAHLERKIETIEPENLPENSQKIGDAVTEIIEYEPGKAYVRRIVRPKYLILNTQNSSNNQTESKIVVAPMPADIPLLGSNAGASLLAQIIISKYIDHLPFYRQIQIFKRIGVELSSSTINDWFSNSTKLLEILYEVLKNKILDSGYIQVDESPIKVLTKDKPGSSHQGWMWVYYSPGYNLVLFDYRSGRDKSGPKEMLAKYQGIIQTDGYSAYKQFAENQNIQQAACMAHARRKFFEAKDENPEVANFVLNKISILYDIERKIKEENFICDSILKIRQDLSKPVMDELKSYLDKLLPEVLPKSLTGKAVAYSLNLWKRLLVYLENPQVLIDNNPIENSIRPLALGRKNYLFAGSEEGAKRTAIMYSLLGSCKKQSVEPYEWLKSTLEKISNHKANRLEELLPGYKA